MKRVLVLGGYGFFGGRIAERLARDPGFDVMVGGRSLDRAQAFCAARPKLRLTPVKLDRDAGLADALPRLDPWLVVDAAGPFQGASYAVARACIASRRHYIDIADGRDFVVGFDALDAEARAAGVTLISGASSVPALSSAVVARLAEGLDRLCRVESAITTGGRGGVGRSVIAAILSYVGKPVPLRQGGRSFWIRGWRDLRRLTLAAGRGRLIGRWVAVCDVPDLAIISDRHPDRPLVEFRAGVESALQAWALWLMSWPVQWGWVADLRPLTPLIEQGRKLSQALGSPRSGMTVRVAGVAGGRPVARRWTLIAEAGRGPLTPSLAAPLLAARLRDGALAAGAYPAAGLLALADFQPDFDALGFATEIVEAPPREFLYRRVMGADFDALPTALRRMHEVSGAGLAEGRARVGRGRHPLARLIAAMMRFPPAAEDCPVTVRFFERDGVETWERRFGEARFASRLSQRGDLLVERFGPLRFGFRLEAEPGGLSMRLVRWWLGPLPMPRALAPSGPARETAPGGVFHFEVGVCLPLIGEVVRYEGWLEPR